MYLRPMSQNAASFGGRFRDLWGLEVLLKQVWGIFQCALHCELWGLVMLLKHMRGNILMGGCPCVICAM